MATSDNWKAKFKGYWEDSVVNKLLILIIISWIILAIVFGFADLSISQAVIDGNSAWGNFGADYGEPPGWALIVLSVVIIIGVKISGRTEKLVKQKYFSIFMILLTMLAFLIGIFIDEEKVMLYGAVIGFSLIIFTLLTLRKDWTAYRKTAKIILLLGIINGLLFVQVVKFTFGRVRPRDVISGEGLYTAWFIINGYTGNQSFPSGHAQMGFMFLPLLMLLKKVDREKISHKIISILGIVLVLGWGIFVGTSRIAVGAHYSSDVLFAAAMASVVTILLYKKIYI